MDLDGHSKQKVFDQVMLFGFNVLSIYALLSDKTFSFTYMSHSLVFTVLPFLSISLTD